MVCRSFVLAGTEAEGWTHLDTKVQEGEVRL